MKKILAFLFIFLFTLFVACYNFYRHFYVFGIITLIFVFIDFIILGLKILKEIRKWKP